MIVKETEAYNVISFDGVRAISPHRCIPRNLADILVKESAEGLQLTFDATEDLEFLVPLKDRVSIKWFSFANGYGSISIERLRHFPELQTLHLPDRTSGQLDLSTLSALTDLAFKYRPPLKSYIDCRGLRSLCITSFPDKDLTRLEPMQNLERLVVSGGKLESLKGIENLKSLKQAEFMFCRKLSSLEGADKVPKGTQSPDSKYSNPTASKISVTACGQISKSTPLAEHVDLDAPL